MLIPALCLMLVSCKKPGEEGKTIEVKVDPTSLMFEAVGSEAQQVAVTANDEWSYSASTEWVHVTVVDAETLSVTVDDNLEREARETKVTVFAKSDTNARAEIRVQQNGAGELTFSITPSQLQFAGEENEAQMITVEASEGLAWEAEADAAWIHVAAEGNQISVTVDDNPQVTERSGKVLVKSALGQKATMIQQSGKTVDMIYDINPTSLTFRWDDFIMQSISFMTSKEVTKWTAYAEDAEGNRDPEWLFVNPNPDAAAPLVEVMTTMSNMEAEARVAYVVIMPEGVENPVPARVEVKQECKPNYHSTLTGDVAMTSLIYSDVTVYPNGTSDQFNFSRWSLWLWSADVVYDPNFSSWSGTGDAVQLQLHAEKVAYEEGATSYVLPAGEYTVSAVASLEDKNGTPGTYIAGGETMNYNYPAGSWLMRRQEGTVTEAGPIASGTASVAYEGDQYTITFNCMDDNGHKITGTYVGKFETINIVPPIEDPVIGGGDGEDPTPEV